MSVGAAGCRGLCGDALAAPFGAFGGSLFPHPKRSWEFLCGPSLLLSLALLSCVTALPGLAADMYQQLACFWY